MAPLRVEERPIVNFRSLIILLQTSSLRAQAELRALIFDQ
jgi:hypothetical protein